MTRPQLSLKALLCLTAVVAAFLGGMALGRTLDEPEWLYNAPPIVADHS
jgi:hypothetical protein